MHSFMHYQLQIMPNEMQVMLICLILCAISLLKHSDAHERMCDCYLILFMVTLLIKHL